MRILVVEDNARLAEGLVAVLRSTGYAVDHAPDGETAVDMMAVERIDLVILDLNLPGIDGIEVLKIIRAKDEGPSVLILTARDKLDDRVRGLDLGADDYLTKPFDVNELEARVRVLLRRRVGLSRPTIEFGRLALDTNSRSFSGDGSMLELPAREVSLLETLIMRAGRVVPKDAIIESLSNFGDELSPNAIEQYVSRVRRRIAPLGLTVRTARGVGYFLETTD